MKINKEKLYYQCIKKLAKDRKWKFKSHFIFKRQGDVFFEADFFVNSIENTVNGSVGFKPYSIDNTFWELTGMPENSEMPLSFRAEAAFRVPSLELYKYNFQIEKEEDLEAEIKSQLDLIDSYVEQTVNENITTQLFWSRLDKENNPVGTVTCLMELGLYEKAIEQIAQYRNADVTSKYTFEGRDFFDLAEKMCRKKRKNGKNVFTNFSTQLKKVLKN